MRVFRLAVAALLVVGIAINYIAMSTNPAFPGAGGLVNFLSFFTILVNIILVAVLAWPVVAPDSAAGRFFDRASTRGGVLLYIVVVGLVYVIVLRSLWNPTGLQKIGDVIVHYCAPVLAVVDWVLFVPRGRLRWGDTLRWLAFPLAYAIYTFVHGAVSGFYPYPFVDVGTLGLRAVLSTMALFVVGFLAIGLAIVVVDRIGARSRAG